MKKIIFKALGLSSLIAMAMASPSAAAQYYGGLNFRLAQFAASTDAAAIEDPGFFIASTALDDHRIRYGLKLGYKVAPYLAVVTRYSDFDRRDTLSRLARNYGVDLESRVPLTSRFSVSGTAGIGRLRSETSFGSGFYPDMFSSVGSRAYTAGHVGLAMQYQVSNSVGLRFNVDRYRAMHGSSMGDLDADHVSFGVTVRF